MARPTLTRHRKFGRLASALGSDVLALGHLEFMWLAAYEDGESLLGSTQDVEWICHWRGDAGVLCKALIEAGFIEERGGLHYVHDLWDHAPDYVRKRQYREAQRRTTGAKIRRTVDSDRSVTGQSPPNGNPRAPAPAPAPALEALPRTPPEPRPKRVRSPDPAFESLCEALRACYQEIRSEPMVSLKKAAFGELKALREAASDAEILRRWRLFLSDAKFYPKKDLNRFRDGFAMYAKNGSAGPTLPGVTVVSS